MKTTSSNYKFRLLARLVIEAETPLAIGSGEKDIVTDARVIRDVNGLPYIPGTALAGVIRNILNVQNNDPLWGFQMKNIGRGSEIVFTEAKILDSKGNPVDGLKDSEVINNDTFLQNYTELPIRQHVSITEKGVAARTGKFDEEVVYKGTRFCFEIEIVSTNEDVNKLENLIRAVRTQTFRLGGNTRNGFGKMKVISVKTKVLDLNTEDGLKNYLDKSSNLEDDIIWWNNVEEKDTTEIPDQDYMSYELELQPVDFILFGSGHGDEKGEADMTTVHENVICNGVLKDQSLIPGTSVKGALRHRVAFYYNKIMGEKVLAPENKAVQELFGFQDEKAHRGNTLISDVFIKPLQRELITHVNIDRFTGGATKGALFTEQTDYGKGTFLSIKLQVKKSVLEDKNIEEALEMALKDICNGMLPLGGGVNRGNGIFRGQILKNGEKYYEGK